MHLNPSRRFYNCLFRGQFPTFDHFFYPFFFFHWIPKREQSSGYFSRQLNSRGGAIAPRKTGALWEADTSLLIVEQFFCQRLARPLNVLPYFITHTGSNSLAFLQAILRHAYECSTLICMSCHPADVFYPHDNVAETMVEPLFLHSIIVRSFRSIHCSCLPLGWRQLELSLRSRSVSFSLHGNAVSAH